MQCRVFSALYSVHSAVRGAVLGAKPYPGSVHTALLLPPCSLPGRTEGKCQDVWDKSGKREGEKEEQERSFGRVL